MENYTINLTIKDCVTNKCNTCSKETTAILTNTNNFVNLQCDYSLKIESVTKDYIIISINNLVLHIIRRLYINIPIRICISESFPVHQISITLNSIEITT